MQNNKLTCNSGCNNSNKKEKRHSDGLGVEVGHFLDPVGSNGALEVSDDSSTKRLGSRIIVVDLSGSTIPSRVLSCKWLSEAESWHDELRLKKTVCGFGFL